MVKESRAIKDFPEALIFCICHLFRSDNGHLRLLDGPSQYGGIRLDVD